MFFLEQRRNRVQVSAPALAALESLRRAGSDQPGAAGRGCPCCPFPASSRPPARLARYWDRSSALAVWQLSNKAPGSHRSSIHSLFSDFCLSNSFRFLSCCYSESNKTKKPRKYSKNPPSPQALPMPPCTAHPSGHLQRQQEQCPTPAGATVRPRSFLLNHYL